MDEIVEGLIIFTLLHVRFEIVWSSIWIDWLTASLTSMYATKVTAAIITNTVSVIELYSDAKQNTF